MKALFGWLVASQPAVLFSHNKSASATSHQPAERGRSTQRDKKNIGIKIPCISHNKKQNNVKFISQIHKFSLNKFMS
jgi:hypothetical protein